MENILWIIYWISIPISLIFGSLEIYRTNKLSQNEKREQIKLGLIIIITCWIPIINTFFVIIGIIYYLDVFLNKLVDLIQ